MKSMKLYRLLRTHINCMSALSNSLYKEEKDAEEARKEALVLIEKFKTDLEEK